MVTNSLEKETVILDAYQVASYWWVKRIKNFAEELKEKEVLSPQQERFLLIFDYEHMGNRGYRAIYQSVYKKFRNYFDDKRKRLRQDIGYMLGGHKLLNEAIEEAIGVEVPNITIGTGTTNISMFICKEKNQEPAVFIGENGDFRGARRLPTKYKSNAIIAPPKKKVRVAESNSENENVEPSEE